VFAKNWAKKNAALILPREESQNG